MRRPIAAVLAALVALAAALAATGSSAPRRTYTVPGVVRSFRAVTGLPLVRFAAASTPDVTSLRTRPHRTRRFGEFQLFVFRPARAAHMSRVFTHGVRPDRRGIYWVPDQAGGWIAVTRYGSNLAVGWFPTAGARFVDARWERLRRAVARLR